MRQESPITDPLRRAAIEVAQCGFPLPSESEVERRFSVGSSRAWTILDMAHEIWTARAMHYFGRPNTTKAKE